MIHINEHEIILDKQERLEPWSSYDRIIHLAMNFIANCPVDPTTNLPWYLAYSCFWIDPLRPTVWPDNPAGKFAWAVTTVIKYYPFTGDKRFVPIIATMLDRLWDYRTPGAFTWSEVPYASAQPGQGNYFGARADGEYVTEPDKIAQVARASIDFYQMTGQEKYLDRARRWAAELAEKMIEGDQEHSPLPFRVSVKDGKIIEAYSAHMIPLVRLFDALIALGDGQYRRSRDQVWSWIEEFPLTNYLWKGHFEDIRLDPENQNRDQLSALETARYLMDHRDLFPDWQAKVEGILGWVVKTLGGPTFYSALPIHEQLYCFFPMGSHTARYASICARYAELTGDVSSSEQARRSFNWATYMANEDGTVTVGIDRPDYYNQCWFTDGYFDYVPHFIDGMAAMPELAPLESDHLLRSSSIVQNIEYQPQNISYRCFSPGSFQRLRLTFDPMQILAGERSLQQVSKLANSPGWYWDETLRVLDIYTDSNEVTIDGR